MHTELACIDFSKGEDEVARAIGEACRTHGFFVLENHGVSEDLQIALEREAKAFFARPVDEKMRVRMELGGRAWRGYFPVGGELTSGKPDAKEGLYFGEELDEQHPLVRAKTPLHGANLFPPDAPELRRVVLAYMEALTRLGHEVTCAMAVSLGLPRTYFAGRYMAQPLTLFRIFNYPHTAAIPNSEPAWGVGEHTDYGFLTLLKQDDAGGLEVRSQGEWIAVPPRHNTFVCNIGDMLERLTGGLSVSTPHRVRNTSGRDRLSFPFFFDPAFSSRVEPIASLASQSGHTAGIARWDAENPHAFEGTYGDYIRSKVARVFPQLFAHALD